jgi:hypothetical protein
MSSNSGHALNGRERNRVLIQLVENLVNSQKLYINQK